MTTRKAELDTPEVPAGTGHRSAVSYRTAAEPRRMLSQGEGDRLGVSGVGGSPKDRALAVQHAETRGPLARIQSRIERYRPSSLVSLARYSAVPRRAAQSITAHHGNSGPHALPTRLPIQRSRDSISCFADTDYGQSHKRQ